MIFFYFTNFPSYVRPVGIIDDRNGKICLIESQYHLHILFVHCWVQTIIDILMVIGTFKPNGFRIHGFIYRSLYLFLFSGKDSLVEICLIFYLYTSCTDKYWFSRWGKKKKKLKFILKNFICCRIIPSLASTGNIKRCMNKLRWLTKYNANPDFSYLFFFFFALFEIMLLKHLVYC